MDPILALAVGITVVVLLVVAALALRKWMVSAPSGGALVVTTPSGCVVSWGVRLVVPVLHRADPVEMPLVRIDIERKGSAGLSCKDNIRGDLVASFFVRINRTEDDLLKVVGTVGAKRASDPEVLRELFEAKFSEALKTVAKQMDFHQLVERREEFRDHVLNVVGEDLNGYALEDLAIDELDQTPIHELDPSNILDAEGIRRITERTTRFKTDTEALLAEEKKMLAKQRLDADEALMAMDRVRVEAETRQARELAAIRSREIGEVVRTYLEETVKAEVERIRAELEIAGYGDGGGAALQVAAERLRAEAVARLSDVDAYGKYIEELAQVREQAIRVIDTATKAAVRDATSRLDGE